MSKLGRYVRRLGCAGWVTVLVIFVLVSGGVLDSFFKGTDSVAANVVAGVVGLAAVGGFLLAWRWWYFRREREKQEAARLERGREID
jgi:hypothetical protein